MLLLKSFPFFSKKLYKLVLPILFVLLVILFLLDRASWMFDRANKNTAANELLPAAVWNKTNQTPKQMINVKSDCKHMPCTSLYHYEQRVVVIDESSPSPSQDFQELIDEPVTPGIKVDLVERALVLKDEFRYANEETKIKILQSLSVSLDLDFIADALTYESATRVREAAAEALFFSSDAQARALLVDALYDRDDVLVATVIKILNRFDDKKINQQIMEILINRHTGVIKTTLQQLGYPID